MCFGVLAAPAGDMGFRSPGCVWCWGTSRNCQPWTSPGSPRLKGSVIVMGIKMDKIIKINVSGHLGLYTPSKCRDDRNALWVQG